MYTRTRAVRMMIVMCVWLVPAVGHAQTSTKASSSTRALTRAIALHDSAVMLYSQPKRALEAARLHMEEVGYRSTTDPEAVEALVMASNLFNYGRQPISARRTMEAAAERALSIGDVVVAAQAYANAAFLAHRSGNESEVRRLGRKAILLSESPLLDSEQRGSIRNRFRASPTFAELLK